MQSEPRTFTNVFRQLEPAPAGPLPDLPVLDASLPGEVIEEAPLPDPPLYRATEPVAIPIREMGTAYAEPVKEERPLTIGQRLRSMALMTVFMIASYVTIVGALSVLFTGVFLTTEHIVVGPSVEIPAPQKLYAQVKGLQSLHPERSGWAPAEAPSQERLHQEFVRYSGSSAPRGAW